LLPLNHHIDFRGDNELQVAAKFGAVNFRRELSQIPRTVCIVIGKTALKEIFVAFGKALPNHCSAGKKVWQRIIMCFISFS